MSNPVMSGIGSIADARLYLQQRIASFGRSQLLLCSGLTFFFILLLTVAPPTANQEVWTLVNVLGWLTPLVCFGGLWHIARRGRASEDRLRTVEVLATGCACSAFPLPLLGGV